MALRDGMWNLVNHVRSLANAGTGDFTVNGIPYWTDERIQDRLDNHSRRVVREPLTTEPEWRGAGSAVYYDYFWNLRDVEESGSGTVIWSVQDSAGSVIARADYDVNYQQRKITFDSDQAGAARYLSYTAYDVYYAAAEVLDEKAAYVSSAYDVASDNHDLKRSQMQKAYLSQAAVLRKRSYYSGRIRGGVTTMKRGDMA